MGLDWMPGNKAKAGCEREFVRLWHELMSGEVADRDAKFERFGEISVSAFETLRAPRVGYDEAATQWAREVWESARANGDTRSEAECLADLDGFYVLELVEPCDGLPRYTNGRPGGDVEQSSFRGSFLEDCEAIIGPERLDQAFASKLPKQTGAYGNDLLRCARAYATARRIDLTRVHEVEDPDTPEFRLDIVVSAGKWCRFWAARGHWLEAYY